MSKMQENVFEAMKTSPKRQYDLEERHLCIRSKRTSICEAESEDTRKH